MQTTFLTAPDIVCGGCAGAIMKTLDRLPGVSNVIVDIAAKQVTVTHEARVDRETLTTAMDRAGFPVTN